MDIINKVVMITGSCGLLGSEISRQIVEMGGKVILGDLNEASGKNT